jgi:transcriptional regulator with XRE-family HTH domain
MAVPQNIVGPTVRKIRYQKGWTQAMLTARCSRVGWDISENIIAKVEAQIRCVTDRELLFISQALRVELSELFPPRSRTTKRT